MGREDRKGLGVSSCYMQTEDRAMLRLYSPAVLDVVINADLMLSIDEGLEADFFGTSPTSRGQQWESFYSAIPGRLVIDVGVWVVSSPIAFKLRTKKAIHIFRNLGSEGVDVQKYLYFLFKRIAKEVLFPHIAVYFFWELANAELFSLRLFSHWNILSRNNLMVSVGL